MSRVRHYILFPALALALAVLYLVQLDGTGAVDPDEPRYIAIGRAMALSGDWILPRLWGNTWFEKPPMVYWLTAMGTKAGLPIDLSGRLPVAILSLLFLWTYFWLLRKEFGFRAAAVACLLLSTSAGWMAYSSLALTDLPLAVFFSTALLVLLPLAQRHSASAFEQRWRMAVAGAALGLAVLSKGLVPLVLILPAFWFCRRCWRQAWAGIAFALLVASPWYVAVYRLAGWPFIEEFFLRHHLARLYSAAIEHVQPFYYYIPVFFGALFPWTPLLALAGWWWRDRRRNSLRGDDRALFLVAVVAFGFLFFSSSLNKLPGYLLPLLPAMFAWIGCYFEHRHPAEVPRSVVVACAILIAAIPFLTVVLPAVLAGQKLARVHFEWNPTLVALALVPVGFALLARRSWLGPIVVFACIVAAFYLKEETLPVLDREVSVRQLYRDLEPRMAQVCDGGLHRRAQYQFALYSGRPLPLCETGRFSWRLWQQGNERPRLEPVQ